MWTVQVIPASWGKKPNKIKKPNYVCPYIVGPLASSNQRPIVRGPLNARRPFCFRVTACSLYIHETIIFTLFSLYLEVNGCQETNEAARNSCTSTRRLPCDAEGGIKQQTSALLAGRGGGRRGIFLLWQTHPDTHTHICLNLLSLSQHTILDSFSLFPSLAQAISQSRFSLAYYIFTYIQRLKMKANAASHYLAPQLLQGSNSWPFSVMSCSPNTRSPLLSRIHSSPSQILWC